MAADLFEVAAQTPAVQAWRRRVESGRAWSDAGVARAAQPFVAVLIRRLFPTRPIVVVTDGLKTQESFHQDITTWLRVAAGDEAISGATKALFFPSWEILPHESKLPHADVVSERLETLLALAAHASDAPAPIVVTQVAALLQRTFPPGELAARTRTLRRGDRIEPRDLIEWLELQGYEPEAQVSQKGAVALRGGIVDLFPLTSPWPVRLEFFGDELESLRHFDPGTQMSTDEITALTVPPAGELGILKQRLAARAAAPASAATPPLATLLEHLPRETLWLLCDPESLDDHAARYADQVPAGDPFFLAWNEFSARLEAGGFPWIGLLEDTGSGLIPLNDSETAGTTGEETGPRFEGLEIYRPIGDRSPEPQIADAQRRAFFGQLHRWLRQGYAVHVFCNNDGEQQRFVEVWRELELADGTAEPGPSSAAGAVVPIPGLHLHLGALTRGFLLEEARLVVVTDAEVFGRYKVQRPRRLKSPHAQTSRSLLDIDFTELEEGDYVVHLQHGIGRYRGLHVLPSSRNRGGDGPAGADRAAPLTAGQECLVIEYAASDPRQPAPKLYVPVTEAHLVSKYVGAGRARPPLNALGGTRWSKAKAHAEHAVRDLASELLALQAARESQAGHAFPPDAPWQREFESAFLYEETPDQMKAILAAKADMERPKPMDRLICGDVGYGKTEVAIRTAFKAVLGGKQVAILVPTTVLAQQHFNTFRERMSDYPVRIDLLSRFRSRREQQRVIAELAAGTVDIVIGTHRLVQSDIEFKNLGLAVIDEEQRFGVMHKEKFKRLRQLVDVLTLSATPIPRTLYLALTGARDMSTIETPPQDRLPVETIVTAFDERVIRDAIRREMNRQGQVFFLHNRVSTIEALAVRLRALVPDARLAVGHGQMDADELEDVMTRFVNGEVDVLLSTTIIESGLDIPNANTIIIDRADRFGLSELYQLRGRVGRYKHQAFAYLLLPRHAGLLTDARKRISAIRQYSSLGSGFKIAMRDLEIRGAGNLLGPQQSGHITAVGFDLYCQLLRQSVGTLKGEPVKRRVEVPVRLDFLSLNPGEQTAPDSTQRKQPAPRASSPDGVDIAVPREGVVWQTRGETAAVPASGPAVRPASAFIPADYIAEPAQRVEIYRKLAQAADRAALDQLGRELRDRFGPPPGALELLLQVAELKLLAADRGVTVIEAREDKLMLTRHNDYLMLGGKFPRLTKKQPAARLKEIKRLLLAM